MWWSKDKDEVRVQNAVVYNDKELRAKNWALRDTTSCQRWTIVTVFGRSTTTWIGPCAVSRQRGCLHVSRHSQIRPRNTAADGSSLATSAWACEVQTVRAHRCLTGAPPRYLAELAVHVASTARRRLRSVSSADLVVPSTRRSTISDRAFAVAGPRAWNSLPSDIRTSTSSFHTSEILPLSVVFL